MLSNRSDIGGAVAPFALAAATLMATSNISYGQQQPEKLFPSVEKTDRTPTNIRTQTEKSFSGFNPRFPLNSELGWALGGAGGTLALLFGIYTARRRIPLSIPYVLAGGVVAFALLNPETTQKDYKLPPTTVIVVTDETASNKLGNREKITQEIRQKVVSQLNGLENVEIKIVRVGDSLDSGESEGTKVFEELRKLDGVNMDRVGAVFFITDGQIHDVPPLSPYGTLAPIYTFLTGPSGEKDRAASLVSAPRFGQVGKEQEIRFRIDDYGVDAFTPQKEIQVQISDSKGKSQILSVVRGQEVTTRLALKSPGTNIYTIKAPKLGGEVTDLNNQIVVNIEGIQEDLNILLISGKIGKDTPILRDFTKSDPNAAVIPLMSLKDPRDIDKTPSTEMKLVKTPVREIFQALNKYNLIIFSGYTDYRRISTRYLKDMVKYVENGGAMLVLSGPEYTAKRSLYKTPIGKSLLPLKPTGEVTESIFTPMLTDDGFRHPITKNLKGAGRKGGEPSWGPWIRVVGTDTISGSKARTLLQTPDGKPLLVIDKKGKGRVAMIPSDSMNIWASGFEGGGPHQQLLQYVSHWLMKVPDVEDEALRVQVLGKEIKINRQTMSISKPSPVEVISPDGKTLKVDFKAEISPGVWQATYPFIKQGVYRFVQKDGDKTYDTSLRVGVNYDNELRKVVSSGKIMEKMADKLGGVVTHVVKKDGAISLPTLRFTKPLGDGKGMHGQGWAGLIKRDVRILEGQKTEPLIPEWIYFVGAAVFMTWGWSRTNGNNKIKDALNGVGFRRRRRTSSKSSDKPSPI